MYKKEIKINEHPFSWPDALRLHAEMKLVFLID